MINTVQCSILCSQLNNNVGEKDIRSVKKMDITSPMYKVLVVCIYNSK